MYYMETFSFLEICKTTWVLTRVWEQCLTHALLVIDENTSCYCVEMRPCEKSCFIFLPKYADNVCIFSSDTLMKTNERLLYISMEIFGLAIFCIGVLLYAEKEFENLLKI